MSKSSWVVGALGALCLGLAIVVAVLVVQRTTTGSRDAIKARAFDQQCRQVEERLRFTRQMLIERPDLQAAAAELFASHFEWAQHEIWACAFKMIDSDGLWSCMRERDYACVAEHIETMEAAIRSAR